MRFSFAGFHSRSHPGPALPIKNQKIPCGNPQKQSLHRTENRARKANTEEMASRVAGRVAARTRNRAAGTGKPYFYGAGRVLGRVSRIYGYSLLTSGITSLFLCGFSSLPLTKWEDKDEGGVPRAHVELVSVVLMLWISTGVSCLSTVVHDDPAHDRGMNRNSRRAKPLLYISTVLNVMRVQRLDNRSVRRTQSTALLPAVRVVRNNGRKHDWTSLEPLHLHRSPSRPRSQSQVFPAGRVSSVL